MVTFIVPPATGVSKPGVVNFAVLTADIIPLLAFAAAKLFKNRMLESPYDAVRGFP
jgi:hypothetical protein